MREAYIIDAVRTPRAIGKVGKGALANVHPQHLAATVLKALQVRNRLNTAEVDDIIWARAHRWANRVAIWGAWPHSMPATTSAPAG